MFMLGVCILYFATCNDATTHKHTHAHMICGSINCLTRQFCFRHPSHLRPHDGEDGGGSVSRQIINQHCFSLLRSDRPLSPDGLSDAAPQKAAIRQCSGGSCVYLSHNAVCRFPPKDDICVCSTRYSKVWGAARCGRPDCAALRETEELLQACCNCDLCSRETEICKSCYRAA
ncbi:hypothetical protein F4680DRAFT_428281 [Xylaria scruposa]|nr:hypothetical protein F4680DRAFT_428281 [Xylaria scruposa]